jgi:hypothetical protein
MFAFTRGPRVIQQQRKFDISVRVKFYDRRGALWNAVQSSAVSVSLCGMNSIDSVNELGELKSSLQRHPSNYLFVIVDCINFEFA